MKKTTINIQNEANIKAEGQFNSRRCKPVVCLDNGKVFTSMLDAADYAGVANPTMVQHLQGKTRTCGGKHFCYLSRITESLDSIVSRLRETSEMEGDAKKWREYQAEQEAIRKAEEKRIEEERKAEEKRQADIAKAQQKLANLNEKCNEYEAKWHATMKAITEVEKELEALGVIVAHEE